jgi:hypothetical protein
VSAVSVINRLLALALALALFLAAAVAVVEIVLGALGRHWIVNSSAWAHWLRGAHWFDGAVRVALVLAVVLGLLLLVAGLRPGRPRSVPLDTAAPATPPRSNGGDTRITASRRAVERVVDASVRRVQGVSAADVSVRRRTVKVTASTRRRDPGDLQQRVTEAVSSRLRDVGLDRRLTPRVRIRTGEAR